MFFTNLINEDYHITIKKMVTLNFKSNNLATFIYKHIK